MGGLGERTGWVEGVGVVRGKIRCDTAVVWYRLSQWPLNSFVMRSFCRNKRFLRLVLGTYIDSSNSAWSRLTVLVTARDCAVCRLTSDSSSGLTSLSGVWAAATRRRASADSR